MDKSQDTQRRIHESIISEINDLYGEINMSNKISETKNIVICKNCNGYGKITEDERISFYDTESKEVDCSVCGGTGRLVLRTILESL